MITIVAPKKKEISHLAFVPGSRLIAAGVDRVMVGVWDTDGGGPPIQVLEMVSRLFALAATSRYVYLTAFGRRTLRWDFAAGTHVEFPGDPVHAPTLALSPDGTRLLIARGGAAKTNQMPVARVELWDVAGETPRLVWRTAEPVPFVGRLAFLPGGERFLARIDPSYTESAFAAGSLADGTWDGPPETFAAGSNFAVLTPSADGNLLISLAGASIFVRERGTGRVVTRIKNPDGITHFGGIAMHPSGTFFATANLGGPVRFWDAATFAPLARFDWGIRGTKAITFSTDGLLCAAGGDKGQIVVWDVD